MDDVDRLLMHCDAVLGGPTTWPKPGGYPTSLALCVIDSIWSLGVKYSVHVMPVVKRYRQYRAKQDKIADRDGLDDLLRVFVEVGGPEGFAHTIGTKHRTSAHASAPLKAAAVQIAAKTLRNHGVNTVTDLLTALDTSHTDLKRAWRRTPGQRSSDVGWRYLLLLAGVDEVKPDRMICRFVANALEKPCVSSTHAAILVTEAALRRGWPVKSLDHAIWHYQKGRPGKGGCCPADTFSMPVLAR